MNANVGIRSEHEALIDEKKAPFLLELGATYIAEPFSRLWYAASMMAFYYLHHDDRSLGYLWAEYRMKMRFELFALRHIEIKEKNRENGQKGGQAGKKQERYDVLDRLARQHLKELMYCSDREGIRIAKRIAAEHDKGLDIPLFAANRRHLSLSWYDEWLDHFREFLRSAE